MKLSLKTLLLVTMLFSNFSYSTQEKNRDTIGALDRIFFPHALVESIENNQFYTDNIPDVLNYLGFWHLRTPENMMEQLIEKISEHHSTISKSRELEQFSTADLQKYAEVCKKHLDILNKEYASLIQGSNESVHITFTATIISIILIYISKKITDVRGSILLSSAFLIMGYAVYHSWAATNSEMSQFHLANLYNLSNLFLAQQIQKRLDPQSL